MNLLREKLDHLYSRYNKFELIHPDPLEFVYNYSLPEDQEAAALIASSLAYGRVAQILVSAKKVLSILGPHPSKAIADADFEHISPSLESFKHRFTSGREILLLLKGMQRLLRKYGSLKALFCTGNRNYLERVSALVTEINFFFEGHRSYLVPSPMDGSACKRLMLFLKWMVRKDEVDPGPWDSPGLLKDLIIPLDTHMYHISKELKFTARKNAGIKTAIEISECFRIINPEDPAKYDFALTRFGIRNDMEYRSLFDFMNGGPLI